MDDAFLSHVIFWLIGAMTLVAVVGSFGALIAMGRAPYRED